MNIIVKKQNLETAQADLLVVNIFANEKKPGGGTGAVDKKLKGLIGKKIKQLAFKGKKAGEYFVFDNPSRGGAKQIMVISLGQKNRFNLEAVRQVAAVSLQEAKKQRAKTMATILHGAGIGGLDPQSCAQAMTEGFLLTDYIFDKYSQEARTQNRQNKIQKIIICQKDKNNLAKIRQGIKMGQIFSQAQNFSRNLVNESPRQMYPKILTEIAKQIAKENQDITLKILDKNQAAKLNMEAYLAVDEGTIKDPYFIHLSYHPKNAKKKVALVGKSITFDSGGLSLKPADSMATMKMDMAGGAAVLGIFSALKDLKPQVAIEGILPACENMPSGSAMRVDDIVTASNGTTIEIVNTDAEGRLTLADGLVYAENLKPDIIIDLATLTGAAIVALGNEIAALMTDDKNLQTSLEQASQQTGEELWSLPLAERYEPHIKSQVADIKNLGKKYYAGTISAGLFLKHFVKNTPWAHLDIAGPAWVETKNLPYLPIGGSGWGVRLLLNYLRNL